MNFYALLPTITSILFLILGFFVYSKNKKASLNKVYLMFCLAIFLWLFPFSLMYWTKDIKMAYIFAKIGFVGVLAIPICIFHLIVTFLNHEYKKYVKILYGSVFVFSVIGFFTKLFYSGIKRHFWGFYPIAGELYILILLQFTLTIAVTMFLLLRNLNNNKFSAIKQQQLKYLTVGFSITVFGAGDYITKFNGVEIYPFGYILTLIFICIISVCIVRTNLMDVKLVLTRTAILVILYILVLGIPFYIGFTTKQWIVSSIILFLLSTIAPIFSRYLQRKAEKILLVEQERYQQFLMQASKGMVEQNDITKLSQLIVRMIKKAVKVQFVCLFIYDEHKNAYCNLAARGLTESCGKEYSKSSEIIKYIGKVKQPIMFLSLSDNLKKELSLISKEIDLIIPSVLRDEIVGFMILGEKLNKSVYSSQDIEVFKTLSNQAGLAIENCNFLEKSKQQQKRLFEAEKLASIGGMADGMAHQIKNRLHQFAMTGGELGLEIEDFENSYKSFVNQEPKVQGMVKYLKEMAETIDSNVKKTNSILQGILNFAKTTEKSTYFSFFSAKEIIESSVELIKVKHQKDKIPISVELPNEDKLYGVKSQIQEVFFNCLDNAFEAVTEKEEHLKNSLLTDLGKEVKNKIFVPEIKIILQYVNKSAKIYIQDNGIGIKPENQAKIFSAFFTTKPSSRSGSGIGSYVVKRMIVENHKGTISFKSQYGVGTTFAIMLPMSKSGEEKKTDNETANN